MAKEKDHISSVLQNAVNHSYSFSLYRSPFGDKIKTVIDPDPIKIDYNKDIEKQSGFLVQAFDIGEKALLIRPSITLDIPIDTFETDFSPLLEPLNEPDTPKKTFEDHVTQAIKVIQVKCFQKVVLSKQKAVKIDSRNIIDGFIRACKKFPNAFVHLTFIPQYGLWFGATPETLLSIQNGVFKTMSLAGTQVNRFESPKEAPWTQKEIEEQAFVSRYIINCFKKIRLREYDEIGPRTMESGHLLHLCTQFEVDMEEARYPNLGSSMLPLLHPTSAVCGMPKERALTFIKTYEAHSRKLYSGFLGPINIDNELALYVNLRCAKLFKNHALLYGGAGITEDSDPAQEWEETEQKCKALGSIFNS